MMTPNEAVQLRIDKAEGLLRLRREIRLGPEMAAAKAAIMGMAALESSMLSDAPLYLWRDDLLRASLQASLALPNPVTLNPELMPTRSGLYLFEADIPIKGMQAAASGIAWHPFVRNNTHTCFWIYSAATNRINREYGPWISFANFILENGSDCDFDKLTVMDGRVKTTDKEFDLKAGSESLLRLLLASWLWLKQSFMTTETHKPTSSVKKAAHIARIPALINVVVLRRRSANAGVAHHQEVEFSCQWMVRGHWRQQFYPSTQERRPLWIESYVKGPDDKPFRAPRETVFQVNR